LFAALVPVDPRLVDQTVLEAGIRFFNTDLLSWRLIA
jgi:hypothetical protein